MKSVTDLLCLLFQCCWIFWHALQYIWCQMSKRKIGNSLGKWKNTNIPVTETTLSYYDKYYYEYGKEERLCLGTWNVKLLFFFFFFLHKKEIQQPAHEFEMLISETNFIFRRHTSSLKILKYISPLPILKLIFNLFTVPGNRSVLEITPKIPINSCIFRIDALAEILVLLKWR